MDTTGITNRKKPNLNSSMITMIAFPIVIALIFMVFVYKYGFEKIPGEPGKSDYRLYWIIADGLRAEPELFDVFRLAEEGELPNINKVMKSGSYGYMVPSSPSQSSSNFASLLTGTYTKTHGVFGGPVHVESFQGEKVAIGGFRSETRKVPAIWKNLEDSGRKVILVSTPSSTPPDIRNGIVIRGRWGGWGSDFNSINIQSGGEKEVLKEQMKNSKLLRSGTSLFQYVELKPAENWENAPETFSPAHEALINSLGTTIYLLIYDSTDDSRANYDTILFSHNKSDGYEALQQGDWSDWHEILLDMNGNEKNSFALFHVIRLEENGSFRIRLVFNNANEFNTFPSSVAAELTANVGPMVDYVDNLPAQLIYYDEDRETFLDELNLSFEWHTKAISFLLEKYHPDAVIHTIFSPAQMLSSRWWMGYLDPSGARLKSINVKERENLWEKVQDMYEKVDEMIGEVIEETDPDRTIIVLSSQQGTCPLHRIVRINNLLATSGLLKFDVNRETGETVINWKKSKAIYMGTGNVYLHPDGLGGQWSGGTGPAYEALRKKIISILKNLKDQEGTRPITRIIKQEDAEKLLNLSQEQAGNLVILARAGYRLDREISSKGAIFSTPGVTGTGDGIDSLELCMQTPFLIMGPGIKKGHRISDLRNIQDQHPTILSLLGVKIPEFVEGRVIEEIFEE